MNYEENIIFYFRNLLHVKKDCDTNNKDKDNSLHIPLSNIYFLLQNFKQCYESVWSKNNKDQNTGRHKLWRKYISLQNLHNAEKGYHKNNKEEDNSYIFQEEILYFTAELHTRLGMTAIKIRKKRIFIGIRFEGNIILHFRIFTILRKTAIKKITKMKIIVHISHEENIIFQCRTLHNAAKDCDKK